MEDTCQLQYIPLYGGSVSVRVCASLCSRPLIDRLLVCVC